MVSECVGCPNDSAAASPIQQANPLRLAAVSTRCVQGSLHADYEDPNQDRNFVLQTPHLLVFAVLDGHGEFGGELASCARDVIQSSVAPLAARPDPNIDLHAAILSIFKDAAEAVDRDESSCHSGCTLTLALVCLLSGSVVVANVGDSMACMVLPDGTVEILTATHRLVNPAEKQRVLATGRAKADGEYVVSQDEKSLLNVTRTLGDRDMRDAGVTTEPTVFQWSMTDHTEGRLVMSTDGLWDANGGSIDCHTVATYVNKASDQDQLDRCSALLLNMAGTPSPLDDTAMVMAILRSESACNCPTTTQM